jgi:hypothetical protein
MLAAFMTYFSTYAFRKPITVAHYEGLVFWEVGYKIILLFSQIGGYAISKFIGINAISEMTPTRRAISIVLLVGLAHFSPFDSWRDRDRYLLWKKSRSKLDSVPLKPSPLTICEQEVDHVKPAEDSMDNCPTDAFIRCP